VRRFGEGKDMSKTKIAGLLDKTESAIRKRLQRPEKDRARHIPDVVYGDDIYLVSYPRSGNTWVRFMLANLLSPAEAGVTFQNIKHFVPDIHQDLDRIESLPRPRFIKSHAPAEPRYPRVIYIVRDGRDVYVSYYHYQRQQLPPDTEFADYLSREHWPCSWNEHVMSWLNLNWDRDRFLLVRYKQLYENPERELRRIAAFSGLDVSKAQIIEAIHNASFESMRKIEETLGHPRQDRFSGPFVRRGQMGNWQDYFGEREKAIFKATENKALVRLGYEQGTVW
jgi:hypothetical protein